MLCCCANFIMKYVLFIANFIFFLAGVFFLAIGIFGLVNVTGLTDHLPELVRTIPTVVVVFGAITLIISFFGCCGAMRENKCLLYMYAACLLALIGGKIWLVTVIFTNLTNLEGLVNDWLRGAFDELEVFDIIQDYFTCCGTSGAASYVAQGLRIPFSCCGVNTCTLENSYPGCTVLVSNYVGSISNSIAIVAVIVIAIELAAVIFAIFVANYGRRNKGTVIS